MMARTPSAPALPDTGMSDDQIADMLTPEERALLEDDEIEAAPFTPADEAAKRDPKPAAREDEEEGEEAPADPAPEKDAPAAAPPADAGRDDGQDPEEEKPAPRNRPADPPLIQPVEDVEGKRGQLKELDEREDALVAKYEDGEITREEYRAGVRAIAADRDRIKGDLMRAELADEISKQERVRNWTSNVRVFLDQHPELEANKTRLASFDVALREFSASEAAKDMGDAQILAAAYKQWRKDMGFADEPARQPAAKPAEKAAVPKRPDLPPSIRQMPAAGDGGVIDDGEFAGLDRLMDTDPLRYQEILNKMPADKLEAYMRTQ